MSDIVRMHRGPGTDTFTLDCSRQPAVVDTVTTTVPLPPIYVLASNIAAGYRACPKGHVTMVVEAIPATDQVTCATCGEAI